MNKRSTINLSGTDYQIGFSFQAIKLFEEMTGQSIQEPKTTWSNLQFCFCTLQALNENFKFTLEQFVELLDENPQLLLDIQFATDQTNAADETQAPAKKKHQLLKQFFGLWMLSLLLWVSPVLIPVIFGSIWIFGSFRFLYRLIAKIGKKRAS